MCILYMRDTAQAAAQLAGWVGTDWLDGHPVDAFEDRDGTLHDFSCPERVGTAEVRAVALMAAPEEAFEREPTLDEVAGLLVSARELVCDIARVFDPRNGDRAEVGRVSRVAVETAHQALNRRGLSPQRPRQESNLRPSD